MPPAPAKRLPKDIHILILDDDTHSQAALHHVLDSEGWQVQIAAMPAQGMARLAERNWTLVIANAALVGIEGPGFETLRDLALAPADEGGKKRARVLFLVPELAAESVLPRLERDRLPFAMKPVNLHDFLERVSDLMLESEAISEPIRRVKHEFSEKERRRTERRSGEDRRAEGMFASRDDYLEMGEEEIAEYERQEAAEAAKKRALEEAKSKDLGGSDRKE